jgi:pilus assembly protein CpaE
MLRSAIIASNNGLADVLASRLGEIGGTEVVRRLDHYPNATELPRMLRGIAPHLVFLSVENIPVAREVAAGIESFAPGTQIAAIHSVVDPQLLLEVMRAGIREFVAAPFDGQNLLEILKRAAEALSNKPSSMDTSDQLYAFLPAKSGVGATTIAANVSAALARRPDQNVLLMDFDLSSSIVGFMLKLGCQHSIVHAAENSSRLDEKLWPQMVSSLGRLDVLKAGGLNPGYRIEPIQVRRILDYARRNYKIICADLSGNMEDYSLEVLQEATRIFLVVTPEIPSLHLACERLSFLRSMELDSNVGVLVTRAKTLGALPMVEIQRVLGRDLLGAFPNDYNGVHRALRNCKKISVASKPFLA